MEKDTKIPTKLILGGIAIIAVLGGLYFFVFSSDSGSSDSSLTTASSSSATDSVGGTSNVDTDDILQRLNELRRIRISIDFFNSPTFLSLRDFGVTINPQPIGRDNPFLPSTYVPGSATIVPRANPAIPQFIGDRPTDESSTTQPASSDSTSSSEESAAAATSSSTDEGVATTSTSTGSQATES